jgi:hypothetical protein
MAGAPLTPIVEPRRDGDAGDAGEPMAAGRRAVPTPRIIQPVRLRPSSLRRVGVPLGRSLRGLSDGFGRPRALPAGSL